MSVKKRREREREARRAAILDAGERVLGEVGYRSLRMEQVAEAAELSKGTLYLYFDGKDALCAGIAERRMRAMAPFVAQAAGAAPNGLSALGRMSRAFSQRVREAPHVIRIALDWFQTPTLDDQSEDFERYRAQVGRVMEMMMAMIRRGQEDGSIRADLDPFHTALHAWSASMGVHLFVINAEGMQKRIGRAFEPAELFERQVEALLRALAATPEAADAAYAASFPPPLPPEPEAAAAAPER